LFWEELVPDRRSYNRLTFNSGMRTPDGSLWALVGMSGRLWVITIAPRQQLEDVVPIGDLEHGWSSSVCLRKIKRLGGKIRAVVYCVYKSEEEYKDRLHCGDCCTLTVSPDLNLPPLAK
jgi:hypothetical protein